MNDPVYVRKMGDGVCATKLKTGNFLTGKEDDADAILDSLGLTREDIDEDGKEVPSTKRFNFMLMVLGDEQPQR